MFYESLQPIIILSFIFQNRKWLIVKSGNKSINKIRSFSATSSSGPGVGDGEGINCNSGGSTDTILTVGKVDVED